MRVLEIPRVQHLLPLPSGEVLFVADNRIFREGRPGDRGGVFGGTPVLIGATTFGKTYWMDYVRGFPGDRRAVVTRADNYCRMFDPDSADMVDGAFRRFWCGDAVLVDVRDPYKVLVIGKTTREVTWMDADPRRIVAAAEHYCDDASVVCGVMLHTTPASYADRYVARLTVYDKASEAFGGDFPVFDVPVIGPTGRRRPGLSVSSAGLVADDGHETTLWRCGEERVVLARPQYAHQLFDVNPVTHEVAGVMNTGPSKNLLVVGQATYDFHKRGKVVGARFSPDGMSLWFWTTENLYHIDVE